MDSYCMDDTDIPLSAVISDTVGPLISDILAHDTHSAFIVHAVTKDSNSYLIPAGDAEEIWVKNGVLEAGCLRKLLAMNR